MDTATSSSVSSITPSCVSPEALEIQKTMMSGNSSHLLKHLLQSDSTSTPSASGQPIKTVADLLQRKKNGSRFTGTDENSINVSNSLPTMNNGVVTKQINGNSTVQLLPNNQILSQPPSQPIVLPPTTIVTSQQNVQTDSQLIQSLLGGSPLQPVNMNSISSNTQTINTQLINQVPQQQQQHQQQQQQQQFLFTSSNTSNVPATPILICNPNPSLTQILQVIANSATSTTTSTQVMQEEMTTVAPNQMEQYLN